MHTLQIDVEDAEYRELQIAKGPMTWREFLFAKADKLGAKK